MTMSREMRLHRLPELPMRNRDKIRAAQLTLLQGHIGYLATHSPFYRRRLDEAGLGVRDLNSLDDLACFPLTNKQDLESAGNELLCVPTLETVDTCLTSGTTGKPITLLQTRSDLERLTYNEENTFRAAGIGAHDRVLIAAAIDRCFMAGLAYFLGLAHIGATSIRGGSSSIAMLAELVRTQRPTALVGVPTLLAAVAARLQSEGDDPAASDVKRLICIGEPVRNSELQLSPLGARLQQLWQAEVYGTYASTEMATAFTDCEAGRGGHLLPDLMVVEILDEQGQPLPPGTPGEVVATPLQVQGMPLLRYRTGDIAVLHDEPCSCGRQTPRLGPVIGRKAQMLKVRGTTLFPPAVLAALQELEAVQGCYLEVRSEYDLSDQLTVVVGSRDPQLRADQVAEQIASRTRVKPEVKIVPPEEIQRKTIQPDKRKPVTFFDLRQN